MKTIAVLLIAAALVACASASCSAVMGALRDANSPVTNEADMIKVVVDAAVGALLQDVSIARYFNGRNGYPNTTGSTASVTALKTKLHSWFFTGLGCINNTDSNGMNITVYTQAQMDLTASHVGLKISKRDATIFNRIVAGAAGGVLLSQNVPQATVTNIGNSLVSTLDSFLTQVLGGSNNVRTSICDRFTEALSTYLLSGNTTATNAFPGAATTDSFKALVTSSGLNFAFWSTFVDVFVIKGAIVSNTTIANTLLPYFRLPISRIDFTDITAGAGSNYNALIRKLAAFFGVATTCTDLEFRSVALAAGGVSAVQGSQNLALNNLTASHQYLYINSADSALFNNIIARVATSFQPILNGIIANSMTNQDLTTIVGLLSSLDSQVVNNNPRPAPRAAPVAAPVATTTAPSGGVTAPRSSAAAVAASGFVVLAASALALLF